MPTQPILKRENWKGKYVWVVRDKQTKRILSRRNVKGSHATKQQMNEKFKRDKTLAKNKVKVQNKLIPIVEDQVITEIGKNTSIVIQDKSINKNFQISAYINWHGKGETKGYSTITSSLEKGKREAFDMAFAEAIRLGYIQYDYSVDNYAGSAGSAVSPSGKITIFWVASYKYFNYFKK